MKTARDPATVFPYLHMLCSGIAAFGLAFCGAGCATTPGGSGHLWNPDQAAIEKAAARDSFPTAAQAGIVSYAPTS